MNKILFFFIFIHIFCNTSFSQEPLVDSLKQRIESLEKQMDEKNYSRVPNIDLDKSLDYIVTEKVSNKVLYWMGAIATVLAFAGFSLLNFMKNSITEESQKSIKEKFEEIKKELKETKSSLEEKLDDEKEKLMTVNLKQDTDIESIKSELNTSLKNLTSRQESTLTDVDERINKSLKLLWKDLAVNKTEQVEKRKYTGTDLIDDLKAILDNEIIELTDDTKKLLIDSLMRCYYSTLQKPGEDNIRNKSMYELLKKYEDKFELFPQTYSHIAIAFESDYAFQGLRRDFDVCIECCNKSIASSTDYGTAYTIKLQVLMISYEKAFDDNERESDSQNILKTFKDIENNKSYRLCIEIIDRFNTDRPVPNIKPYIEQLEKTYPVQMMDINERACTDIFQNQLMTNEKYSKLAFSILEDYSGKELNLQGGWKAVKVVIGGAETPVEEINLELNFNKSVFEFKSLIMGYALFLPYNKIPGINFYQMKDEKSFVKLIPAIYKIENGQLHLCSNYLTTERPEDFVSTPENKYYYEVYERII
jgi:hypothetical protein